ncbi:LysR family transcriptional regulator [Pseudoalteromonas luteoviolacea]|uniref:LysR family transcriptional regulator n=1 Tax=Pseudoalteromonas luteoviolacea TaxID=43657 RepID=UPI001B35DEAF|nr:LysR family transcriptional regulator [Pseudoalteromonas luteoviolacea]MBQ4838099.1 LysR family transcriptional regulator [Pseudoalteromonas luteoviolacea]
MDKWTEFKTAYRLAKLRTLSATAEDLGIHRSTVMRHIDALEAHIGVKLFQRNDKGYIPTEAGLEVMRLGEITDVQFKQFIDKTTNPSALMEGVLKITCVSELSVLLFPVIRQFQTRYPNVRFEILGDIRKYDLEYGEADLAIRMGEKPQTLDNIVIPFQRIDVILCAHQTYIEKHGLPTPGNVSQHQFLANSERIAHLPWNEWIHTHIPHSNIVTTSNSYQVLDHALHAGCGISIATKQAVQSNNLLHELAIGDHWQVNSWILVHRDIIHIPKVRKFIDMLKCASPFGET